MKPSRSIFAVLGLASLAALVLAGGGDVAGQDPDAGGDRAPAGEVPSFPRTALEDEVYTLTLNVIGDDTVLLDTLDIYVLVPGSSY